MARWGAFAVVAFVIAWGACIVWQNSAQDARAERAMVESQQRLTDRLTAMREGRTYVEPPPAEAALPLPARSPLVSALVVAVVVFIGGPALSILFAAEARRSTQ